MVSLIKMEESSSYMTGYQQGVDDVLNNRRHNPHSHSHAIPINSIHALQNQTDFISGYIQAFPLPK